MNTLKLFYILISTVKYVHSQFVSTPHVPVSGICAGGSNTAPVEHFFNLIFSEFHSQPPVCVCVQMCAEQLTYCYPNGCFKKDVRADIRKKHNPPAQVSQVQADKLKPMSFLVDSQSDFMENLLSNKFVSEPKIPGSKYDPYKTRNEIHRDPFKDRYQSIFKYRKAPKIHLRYNLREQVKNMKSDVLKIEKIDVSKTRWPLTQNKQFFIDNQDKSHDNSHFFPSIILDNGPVQYQSKFFKRDLAKNFLPKEVVEVVENSKENISYSLENLIKNLIEHSFGPLVNDTELDLNVKVDYSLNNNMTTTEPITLPYKRSVYNTNSIKKIILNETTNVVSMNMTNENLDENKYTDNSGNKIYKNVFNDMIESLSRNIEKNNNSSVEMMEQVLGHPVTDTTQGTAPTLREVLHSDTTTNIPVIKEVSETEIFNQDTTDPVKIEKERKKKETRKKSHQRITRKLQISKNN